MQPFRFVHAADLHLDAPFRGLSLDSEELGRRVRESTLTTFERLVELCLQVQADGLLIAGDVYNQEDRSLRAQLRFRDGLARLAEQGLQVFVAHGNHDPTGSASRALQWPEEVHVFEDDEPACRPLVRNGRTAALIHGASHVRSRETRNLARRFAREGQDVLQIGLLHCNLGSGTGHEPYAPCELADLEAAGLDYWALGHVHAGGVRSRDPWVVYPGNLQGLHIGEAGPKGCYLVDVGPEGVVQLDFRPLEAIRWFRTTVDIAGLQSLDRLEQAVLEAVEAGRAECGDRGVICRVQLQGRGRLHSQVREEEAQDELLQRLREHYTGIEPLTWIKDLRLDTAPDIDLEARSREQDFLGEALKQAETLLQREDRLEVLHKEVLAELFGHRRARKFLQGLSLEEADELIRRAEILCADHLDTDRGG